MSVTACSCQTLTDAAISSTFFDPFYPSNKLSEKGTYEVQKSNKKEGKRGQMTKIDFRNRLKVNKISKVWLKLEIGLLSDTEDTSY